MQSFIEYCQFRAALVRRQLADPAPGPCDESAKIYDAREENLRALYSRIRSAARSRGYVWTLPIEQFKSMISQRCAWCNDPPSQRFARSDQSDADGARDYAAHALLYKGLDRRSNSGGYELENLLTSWGACNLPRGSMSIREFRRFLRRAGGH